MKCLPKLIATGIPREHSLSRDVSVQILFFKFAREPQKLQKVPKTLVIQKFLPSRLLKYHPVPMLHKFWLLTLKFFEPNLALFLKIEIR